MIIELAILAILAIASILDLKTKKVPSFFLTSAILASTFLFLDNIQFALIAGVFGLLLYEFNYFSGIADIKALILIGLSIPTIDSVLTMMLFVMFAGVGYQALQKKRGKTEIAFLPVITAVYLMMILGGLVG